MAYNEELAARVRKALGRRKGVKEQKMFGGIAFMLHGNMCCGVVTGDLMVRVGPDAYEDALAQRHAREMDFTGRPLKGMVYVSSRGIEDDEDLTGWVTRGVTFAGSLPAK